MTEGRERGRRKTPREKLNTRKRFIEAGTPEQFAEVERLVEGIDGAVEALEFALDLHIDQMRPDGPYMNHILRVVRRVVEDYGVRDRDVVIATALHDAVEDQLKSCRPRGIEQRRCKY